MGPWLLSLLLAFGHPPTPFPPHPLSDCIPNLHSHPATEQKPHPEKKIRALVPRPPLPVLIFIFSYSSPVPSFVSAGAAEEAAGSCLPAATLPGWGTGPGPEAPSPPRSAGFGHIPRLWDLSPVPPRAFGPGIHLVLSLCLNPQRIHTQGYL